MIQIQAHRNSRWFILAVLFLVVNTYGVIQVTRRAAPDRWFSVVNASPELGTTVEPQGQLTWEFSSDMVAPEDTETWMTDGPIDISPATDGSICWLTTRTLVFRPDTAWQPCTPYTVHLDEGLRDAHGRKLREPYVSTFQTEPLRVKDVVQVDFSGDRRCSLRLEFNAAPVRSRLEDHIAIQDADGKDISFDIAGHTESPVILLRTHPIGADTFTLKVKHGLPSTAGPLGLPRNSVWTCTLSVELAVTRVKPVSSSFERGAIDVHVSAPLDVSTLQGFVDVSPATPIAVNQLSFWQSSGCRVVGDFKPGTAYTLTLKKGLRATNGAVLKQDVTRQVYFPDRPASLAFRTAGRYLSSRGRRLIPVSSVNVKQLHVTSERIYPNNIVYFAMRESDRYPNYYARWTRTHHQGISHVVAEREYGVAHKPNETVETYLNMSDLMGAQDSGAFLLTVAGSEGGSRQHMVVVSDIGISVKQSPRDLVVWANSILTLAPVADADVRVYSAANQEILRGTTDADGVIHLSGELDTVENTPFLVTVARGDDVSYLKLDGTRVGMAGDTTGDAYLASGYEGHVFTDRGIYRPGETCHAKAVIRDAAMAPPSHAFPVTLHVIQPGGKEFTRLTSTLSALGTVEYALEWPAYARTGRYRLEARIPGTDNVIGSTHVSVEEFVPPQIRVSVDADDARIRNNIVFDVTARHLFGRAAAHHPASAIVQFTPEPFAHADWAGYIFSDPEKSFSPTTRKIGKGTLDGNGVGRFAYTVPAEWLPPSALRALIGATVRESSGRSVTAYASRPVDIYPYYVGIRPASRGDILKVGQTYAARLAAVLPDGTPARDVAALTARLQRISWSTVLKERDDHTYAYVSERHLTSAMECRVGLDAGTGELTFTPPDSGQYLLTVESIEERCSASLQFYAGAADHRWLAWSMASPGTLELDLDQDTYAPGDTAHLVVKSPFAGRALLTIESDRVLSTRVVELNQNTAELDIPVRADYPPTVYCSLSVIRAVEAGQTWSTHRAVGTVPLRVAEPSRALTVELDCSEQMRPLSTLSGTVTVTDTDGNGVRSEVTVAVVDEGICMLTAFQTPDPLDFFQRKRGLGVNLYDLYAELMPEVSDSVLATQSEPGGDVGGALRRRLNPIDARRFKPVALWTSSIMTGPDGRAVFNVDIPEFSGELRVMAVAVARRQFGSADAPVTVKRPLVVLSSLPRFLAPGDRCSIPVHVFNETGEDRDVNVRFQTGGALAGGVQTRTRAVADGAEESLTFALTGNATPGLGTVRLAVTAGDEAYAEDFELAVRPASPRVTRAGSGSVPPGESAAVRLPSNWLAGTEQHMLVCSGLPALTLSGGLDYLLRYPYGCLEQTTSTAFPLLYLADVAAILKPGTIGRDAPGHLLRAGLFRILSMQRSDGSFGYWPAATHSYTWGSVYATHFLVEAAAAGLDVPAERRTSAVAHLKTLLEKSVAAEDDTGAWDADMSIRAYACHVLALAGEPTHGWVDRLAEQARHLNVSSRIHLAHALALAGKRPEAAALARTLELGNAAATVRQTGGCLESSTRDTARLLACWIDIDPLSPAVPHLAARLESLQNNGHWPTTQENAAVLLALGKYCRLLQREKKPFAGEVSWSSSAGDVSRRITGEATARFSSTDPEAPFTPVPGQGHVANIVNHGPGTVFYYWRSAGIATDGVIEDADRGLSVRRRLLDIEGNPSEIRPFAQGEMLVVELEVDTGGRDIDNLVIEDLLPAGLEVENPELATSPLVPWVKQRQKNKTRHVDLRDDRVIFFPNSVRGVAHFYYAVRAVTPGTYTHPPVYAECMYDPLIRSVHGAGRVIIASEE